MLHPLVMEERGTDAQVVNQLQGGPQKQRWPNHGASRTRLRLRNRESHSYSSWRQVSSCAPSTAQLLSQFISKERKVGEGALTSCWLRQAVTWGHSAAAPQGAETSTRWSRNADRQRDERQDPHHHPKISCCCSWLKASSHCLEQTGFLNLGPCEALLI